MLTPPPLSEGHKANFQTLLRAAAAGHLGLISTFDAQTNEPRAVLAAMVTDEDGNTTITPFGHLANGNPYEEYVSP